MNSCPTRCASLNRAKTTWAQDVPVVEVDVGLTAEGDGCAEVEPDDCVGLPPVPHAEPTSSRASAHPRARTGFTSTAGALDPLPSIDVGVHPVPVREADPWAYRSDLGDAVLPRPLRLAPGNQKVSSPGHEDPRLSTALRPQQELSRIAQRDERHDRIVDLLGDPIGVPCHAVPSVSVEIEAH